MVATNDQKARFLDLITSMLELARDGKRPIDQLARVLQVVKDDPNFVHVLFPSAAIPAGDVNPDLEKFYKEVYGLKRNFSKVRIPERKEGFNRLLVMPKGLTLQQIVEVMRKSMKVELYIDLNKVTSNRKTDRDYAIWLRDRQEADVELKNLSAKDLQQKGIPGITLEERLVFHQFYYWKFGLHLDVQNLTLCSGSRYVDADGGVGVPRVYWSSSYGEVQVGWYYLDVRSDYLRCCEAVS